MAKRLTPMPYTKQTCCHSPWNPSLFDSITTILSIHLHHNPSPLHHHSVFDMCATPDRSAIKIIDVDHHHHHSHFEYYIIDYDIRLSPSPSYPHHHSVFDMCATPDRGSAEMDEIWHAVCLASNDGILWPIIPTSAVSLLFTGFRYY